MKKFLLLLVCCFALLGLTSCGKNKVVGEWELAEMTIDMGGATTTIKAGEEFQGMTIEKDFYTMEFDKDGTGVMKSSMSEDAVEEFNWEYDDGEYTLTPVDAEDDSEAITVTIEDDYLVLSMGGSTIKFSKK